MCCVTARSPPNGVRTRGFPRNAFAYTSPGWDLTRVLWRSCPMNSQSFTRLPFLTSRSFAHVPTPPPNATFGSLLEFLLSLSRCHQHLHSTAADRTPIPWPSTLWVHPSSSNGRASLLRLLSLFRPLAHNLSLASSCGKPFINLRHNSAESEPLGIYRNSPRHWGSPPSFTQWLSSIMGNAIFFICRNHVRMNRWEPWRAIRREAP